MLNLCFSKQQYCCTLLIATLCGTFAEPVILVKSSGCKKGACALFLGTTLATLNILSKQTSNTQPIPRRYAQTNPKGEFFPICWKKLPPSTRYSYGNKIGQLHYFVTTNLYAPTSRSARNLFRF